MGKPEQGGSGAIVAVIVVGMLLLFVVVGGALVLVGGLFFLSVESQPMTVVSTQPSVVATAAAAQSRVIEIDAEGNITMDGEPLTPEELRTNLSEAQQEYGYVHSQLSANDDCPAEVRANVISICEEVLGVAPEILVAPMPEPPAPTVDPGDSTE